MRVYSFPLINHVSAWDTPPPAVSQAETHPPPRVNPCIMSGTCRLWLRRCTGYLVFTRYCFTSTLYCGSQSSFLVPFPTYKACPIAMLLHDYCAIYDPPATPLVHAMHDIVLAMAISCEGQPATPPPPPLQYLR